MMLVLLPRMILRMMIGWMIQWQVWRAAKEASDLKMHKQGVHNIGVVWHQCDSCDHKAKKAGNLKKHKQGVHNIGVVWHQCDSCDHKAKKAGNLKKHKQHVHNIDVLWHNCDLARPNSLDLNNFSPTSSPIPLGTRPEDIPTTPPTKDLNRMPLPTPIKQFKKRESPRFQMQPCLKVLLGRFGWQADVDSPSPWGKVTCAMSKMLDFESKLALNSVSQEARRLMRPKTGLDASYFWIHFDAGEDDDVNGGALKVDRFGGLKSINPPTRSLHSPPHPFNLASLGARFTFRRVALAVLQSCCKHCGGAKEKLFFNAFICEMTCRECWHEGGELCSITYAQAKLPISAHDFTTDFCDDGKIFKHKTDDSNLIWALGHSNATLTICSYPMALKHAIDQKGEYEVFRHIDTAKKALEIKMMTLKDKGGVQTHSRGIGSTQVNLAQRNQAFHSKGQLWYYMNQLGLYYLPRPGTVLKREIKVLVSDMRLQNCENLEVVTPNLYKGLMYAIPAAHVHRDHLFTAAIIGVAKHCCMISMFDELTEEDKNLLYAKDVLEKPPLFKFGQSQTKAIRSCNTRILGILDDNQNKPIIESDAIVFINDFELTITDLEFRKQIDVANPSLAKYDAVLQNVHEYKTYTTIKNCDVIELPFEYHGEWDSDDD
ncbi:hypothetical protein TrLO_g15410 [Triparma laevis f. longispina]|uniref:C2H2-type domain-containing protein n=1 Tax=Triparma laevis f. longispina TaxID=1714387 RepID=A0A9W7EAA4_9STRA|nr:hypothetical protein TrLO_g15410 [Triparma laevis f. longispina]